MNHPDSNHPSSDKPVIDSYTDNKMSVNSIGQVLRDTRLSQSKNIQEVSQILRIRQIYLDAIENNDFAQLPGKIYIIGFIKTYAEYLQLDSEEIIRAYKSGDLVETINTDLVFPTIVPEDGMPNKLTLLLGFMIAIAGYGGWYYFNNNVSSIGNPVSLNKSEIPKPSQIEKLKTNNSLNTTKTLTQKNTLLTSDPLKREKEIKNADPRSSIKVGLGGVTGKILSEKQDISGKYNQVIEPQPLLQNSNKPLSLKTNIKDKISTLDTKTKVVNVTKPLKPKLLEKNNVLLPKNKVIESSRITIRALSDSYLQVRNKSLNQILITRLLKKGSTYDVPNQEGLSLITGNAGALEIFVDGQKVPPIGAIGSVRRNVLLVPKDLIAGTSIGE
ncbi:MAG: helix-turn-helix domain-containing protein [Rhodospirillales bacterium]|nr:helix-turn-helix domain-containing protein [Rhodospirillales bacterium]